MESLYKLKEQSRDMIKKSFRGVLKGKRGRTKEILGCDLEFFINYLLETLPQLEGEQKDTDIEKYLPWSEELPDEIRNYEEEYTELNLE